MTGPWTLPTQAALGGGAYAIRTDYRDILELLRWLGGQADPALDQAERWYVAMGLFYPEFDAMAQDVWPEATRFLAEFLAAGRREETRPGPALMDWQLDFYRTHRAMVELRPAATAEEQAEKQRLLAMLG